MNWTVAFFFLSSIRLHSFRDFIQFLSLFVRSAPTNFFDEKKKKNKKRAPTIFRGRNIIHSSSSHYHRRSVEFYLLLTEIDRPTFVFFFRLYRLHVSSSVYFSPLFRRIARSFTHSIEEKRTGRDVLRMNSFTVNRNSFEGNRSPSVWSE